MMMIQPRIGLEEAGELALPPIPLPLAVNALRIADHALDAALDLVWTTEEGVLADQIQAGLKATTDMLHQVSLID